MLKLLHKTLGLSFYQQHAGLFLVSLYLLFGAVEGSQLISYHKAILMAICSSPMVLGILFFIWTLYAIKSFFFVRKKLNATAYQFLTVLTSIPKKEQYRLWIKFYGFILLPILTYGALILVTAIKIEAYDTLVFTIIGLIVLLLCLSVCTFNATNFTFLPKKNWITIPQLKIKRPFWIWPIFFLLNEQRVNLLIVKVVSIFFLKAVLFMFADVGNDVRVYLTAILAVILSHAVLIFNLVKFDAFYLSFVKSMPIKSISRLFDWILIFFFILLPELLLLYTLTAINLAGLFYCVLLAIGAMLFLQVMVYLFKADMERYLKYLLFFFFVAMWLILAGYYFPFSLCCIICSFFIYLLKINKMDLKELN